MDATSERARMVRQVVLRRPISHPICHIERSGIGAAEWLTGGNL
jgi:hypothetical protein